MSPNPNKQIPKKIKGKLVSFSMLLCVLSGVIGWSTVSMLNNGVLLNLSTVAANLTGYGCGVYGNAEPVYGGVCSVLLSSVSSSTQSTSAVSSTPSSSTQSSSTQSASVLSSSTPSSSTQSASVLSSSTQLSSVVTSTSTSTLTSLSSCAIVPLVCSSSSVAVVIGTPAPTTANPLIGLIGSPVQNILLIGSTLPNGTPATLQLSGAVTVITGTIQNSYFVPASGQLIPLGATIGPSTSQITINGTVLLVPTNISNNNTDGGGSITFSVNESKPAVISQIVNNTEALATNPIINNVKTNTLNIDNSSLNLKDPYVCGGYVFGYVITDPKVKTDLKLDFSKNGVIVKSYTMQTNDDGSFQNNLKGLPYDTYAYKVTSSYQNLSDSEEFVIVHKTCESALNPIQNSNPVEGGFTKFNEAYNDLFYLARTGGINIGLLGLLVALILIITVLLVTLKRDKFNFLK